MESFEKLLIFAGEYGLPLIMSVGVLGMAVHFYNKVYLPSVLKNKDLEHEVKKSNFETQKTMAKTIESLGGNMQSIVQSVNLLDTALKEHNTSAEEIAVLAFNLQESLNKLEKKYDKQFFNQSEDIGKIKDQIEKLLSATNRYFLENKQEGE